MLLFLGFLSLVCYWADEVSALHASSKVEMIVDSDGKPEILQESATEDPNPGKSASVIVGSDGRPEIRYANETEQQVPVKAVKPRRGLAEPGDVAKHSSTPNEHDEPVRTLLSRRGERGADKTIWFKKLVKRGRKHFKKFRSKVKKSVSKFAGKIKTIAATTFKAVKTHAIATAKKTIAAAKAHGPSLLTGVGALITGNPGPIMNTFKAMSSDVKSEVEDGVKTMRTEVEIGAKQIKEAGTNALAGQISTLSSLVQDTKDKLANGKLNAGDALDLVMTTAVKLDIEGLQEVAGKASQTLNGVKSINDIQGNSIAKAAATEVAAIDSAMAKQQQHSTEKAALYVRRNSN